MIYLVCFFVSVALAYYANKTENRKHFLILSGLSILVTVLLAGLRDYSIGIDTENYMSLKRYWGGAVSYDSLRDYMRFYISIGYGEPLFALIIGSIGQLTGNYSVFLFVAHAMIITCVYIGAFRQKKHVEPALVLVLFYLFFYSHSLNITRQYMAMSILFAALADIEQRKHLRFCVAVGVAALIHTTALIGLGALLVYWVLYGDFKKVIPSLNPSFRSRQMFIVASLSVVVIVFPLLCKFLIDIGVLLSKYGWFLNFEKAQHTTMVSLLLVMEMIIVFHFRKQMKKRSAYFDFFMICSVAYLILQQLSASIVYGKRIAAYYSLSNILTISLIQSSFRTKKMRMIATGAILVFALAYWWYTYVLRNASETYPYVFIFANL